MNKRKYPGTAPGHEPEIYEAEDNFLRFRVRSERVCKLWKEERESYDSVMEELVTDHQLERKLSTNLEFLDHLLDVHRIWCRSCRPSLCAPSLDEMRYAYACLINND